MLIPLAFLAVMEGGLTLLLISRIEPLTMLGRAVLDLLKTTKGAAISKTLAATFVVLLASDVASICRIQKRIRNAGSSHADQFIIRSQMLEATLIGFCLLLGLVVGSLHTYLKELEGLKRNVDALKKQSRGAQAEYLRLQSEQSLKDTTDESAAEVKSLKDVISDLRQKLENLQLDTQSKEREAKAAKANAQALEKQAEGFLNEYNRLMDDNENLRNQLSTFDRKYANSTMKKYS